MKTSPRSESPDDPGVDILLVTATDTETMALSESLKPLNGETTIHKVTKDHLTYGLAQFGSLRAAHLQCAMASKTADAAPLAVYRASATWKPRAVVMVGIAWGNPGRHFKLGDVLVASSVQDFETAKISHKTIVRGEQAQASLRLLDRFKNAKDWKYTFVDSSIASIRVGLLLSGDKLFANAAFRDSYLSVFETAIGGDMEGYGVSQACRTYAIDWIVVKGICDWGDEKKDDAWQLPAARAAVSLCLTALGGDRAYIDAIPEPKDESAILPGRHADLDVPNEIPPGTDSCVGRAAEVGSLVEKLREGTERTTLALIVGMGGAGKSFVAAEVARRLVDAGAFPGGVVWHESVDRSAVSAMSHVIGALGGEPAQGSASPLSAYRRALRDRKVLLVLDNAFDAPEVSMLLTDLPGSALLVTTRNRMPSLRGRARLTVDLEAMPMDEAVELLKNKANRSAEITSDQFALIAARCGYLPLALSVAGGLLSERVMWPAAEAFIGALEECALSLLEEDGGGSRSVRSTLLLSYVKMEKPMQRLFRSLAVQGQRAFGASAVAYVLGVPKAQVSLSLTKLVGRSVLERSAFGQFSLHDLLGDLSAELLENEEDVFCIEQWQALASRYWTQWQRGFEAGKSGATLMRSGLLADATTAYQTAIEIDTEIDDRKGLAAAHGGLAAIDARTGKPHEAYERHAEALKVSLEIADSRGIAKAHGGMAAMLAKQGRDDEALKHYEEALKVARAAKDRSSIAGSAGGIAAIAARRQDTSRAIACYEEAAELNLALENWQGLAQSCGGRASIHARRGEWTEAEGKYQEAVSWAQKAGDALGEGLATGGMGRVYLNTGRLDEAMKCYEKAAVISDKFGKAEAIAGLASVFLRMGNTSEAIEPFAKAAQMQVEGNDWPHLASTLGGLAKAYRKESRWPEAMDTYEKVLDIEKKLHAVYFGVRTLCAMASVCVDSGDTQRAEQLYGRALEEIGEKENAGGRARAYGGLARIYSRKGLTGRAIEYYRLAEDENEKSGDKGGLAIVVEGLARIYFTTGNYGKAIECSKRALGLAEEAEDIQRQAEALRYLAGSHEKMGLDEKAIGYYEAARAFFVKVGNRRRQETIDSSLAQLNRKDRKAAKSVAGLEDARRRAGEHEDAMKPRGTRAKLGRTDG